MSELTPPTKFELRNWPRFYNETKGRQDRKLLVEALKFVIGRDAALDIGAGSLQESVYLIGQGFQKIVAVDSSDEFLDMASKIKDEKLEVHNLPIQDYKFIDNAFDLVTAQYTLPFVGRDKFSKVWESIHMSLKVGGVFTGQFFGDRDKWNSLGSRMVFHSRKEVEDLCNKYGYEILSFQEKEYDGAAISDTIKHWHIFNLILRKK